MRPILAEDNPLVEAQQLERQYDAVRQQIQRIPDDVKRLDEAIKRDKSSKDIQDFRRVLSDALSVLSDNGSLEALTKSYVSQLENALKVAQEDEHFSPEQRKTLVDGWNQKLSEARKKISALSMARKNVSEMLGYAQTEEDYLNEVIKIKSQDEVLEMLDAFTKRLNDLSDNLKSIQTAAPGT